MENSPMDGLQKEDIQRMNGLNEACHEGDSVIYVNLAMMCYNVRRETMAMMREKVDLVYVRKAITQVQWGRLYDIIAVAGCLNATSQTVSADRETRKLPQSQNGK